MLNFFMIFFTDMFKVIKYDFTQKIDFSDKGRINYHFHPLTSF